MAKSDSRQVRVIDDERHGEPPNGEIEAAPGRASLLGNEQQASITAGA